MEKEDIAVLSQLIKTLEDTELKLEEAYSKKNSESFNKSKKFMLGIQAQISKVLK